MADIEQAVRNLKDQVTLMADRVAADVAELRRLVEAGATDRAAMESAVASIEQSTAQLAAIDPNPDFPAQSSAPTDPAAPSPTAVPDDGGHGPAPDGSPTA